jgi:hypothetical protein
MATQPLWKACLILLAMVFPVALLPLIRAKVCVRNLNASVLTAKTDTINCASIFATHGTIIFVSVAWVFS